MSLLDLKLIMANKISQKLEYNESLQVDAPKEVVYSQGPFFINSNGVLSETPKLDKLSRKDTTSSEPAEKSRLQTNTPIPDYLIDADSVGKFRCNSQVVTGYLGAISLLTTQSGWYRNKNGALVYFTSDFWPLLMSASFITIAAFLLLFLLPQLPLTGWKLHFLV